MNNKFVDKFTKPFSKLPFGNNEEKKPLRETMVVTDEKIEKDGLKQVFLSIYRPQVKFTNDYINPKNIGDLVDDVILYILSYLDVGDLIKVGRLNHNWRNISENDSLWEPIYKQKKWRFLKSVEDSSDCFKSHYLKALETENSIGKVIHSTEVKEIVTKTTSNCSRWGYGLLLPVIFIIGLIILTILLPIVIDGSIQFNQTNSFWIFVIFTIFCLVTYLLIAFGVGIDSYLFSYLKKYYYEKKAELLNSQDVFIEETDHDSRSSANEFVWGVAWLPLSIFCLLIKGWLFPQLQFTVAFIPVYLLSVIYTCLNPFTIIEYIRLIKEGGFSLAGVFTHLLMITINIWISLQLLFIGLRLDQTVNMNWGIVFIPTWIILVTIFMCSLPSCTILAASTNSSSVIGWVLLFMIVPCLLGPIILFFIILTIRLEGIFFGFSYFFIFIPCIFCEMVFCFCLCICSIVSLGNGFYSMD